MCKQTQQYRKDLSTKVLEILRIINSAEIRPGGELPLDISQEEIEALRAGIDATLALVDYLLLEGYADTKIKFAEGLHVLGHAGTGTRADAKVVAEYMVLLAAGVYKQSVLDKE